MEIVVSRLNTDTSATTTAAKNKKKNMAGDGSGGGEGSDAQLCVHLYYRRESHSGQKTWVLVSKVNCLPNRDDNGAMVVAFREKAKRELSKFRAPVFPLPSAFNHGCQLHLVVHAGDDGGGGGGADGPGRGGGRAGPKTLGECKFHIKDLLNSARQLTTNLNVVNTQTKYGEVTAKSGQVALRLAPTEETRGWKTRHKTPGGVFSFEELSAALKKEMKEEAERAKYGSATSEWAAKKAAGPRNSDGGGGPRNSFDGGSRGPRNSNGGGGEPANATKRSLAHVRQRGGGARDVPREDVEEPSGANNDDLIRHNRRSARASDPGIRGPPRLSRSATMAVPGGRVPLARTSTASSIGRNSVGSSPRGGGGGGRGGAVRHPRASAPTLQRRQTERISSSGSVHSFSGGGGGPRNSNSGGGGGGGARHSSGGSDMGGGGGGRQPRMSDPAKKYVV